MLIATPCFAESPRIVCTQEGFNDPICSEGFKFRDAWECFQNGDCKIISTPAQQEEERMPIGVIGEGMPTVPTTKEKMR
jgi:hypothetical protein